MRSTIRQFSVATAALTLLAATTVAAQVADSTQRPPTPGMRGGMGPNAGMRGRFAPGDDFGPGRGGRMRGPGGDFRQGAPGMRAGRGLGQGRQGFLRGITLSTDQQKALRSAQAKHLLETKPLMMEMLSARTDEQLARLNGDQKALDAASARLTTTRTRLDSLRGKRSPIETLRSVLTPDQQKILDKNLAERGPGAGDGRGFGPGEGRGMRGMRDGAGPRGFRNGPLPRRPAGEDTEQDEQR